ncbi:MAG TPA: hypothetical protein VFG20_21925 [Planctomycetaceae bacterium]|jgi:hypothetical protein|nr:hypothetical protein [Planctomycetaceae bacterium]
MTTIPSDDQPKFIPHGLFVPTDRADFNIPWDAQQNWERRHNNVKGTTAEIPFGMLALYWKYAWSTARSPWLMPELFEAMVKREGAADKVWNMLIGGGVTIVETTYFVVGTQVLAYSGFYFAYEHFLVSCCEARLGRPIPDAIGYKQIKSAVETAFNPGFERQVWSHPDVERIRRIRNDLVHRSGIPKPETSSIAADVVIERHLQITPNDIKEEMDALTPRIDLLTSEKYPKATS